MKKFTIGVLLVIFSFVFILAGCGESTIKKADNDTSEAKAVDENADKVNNEEKEEVKEIESLKVGESVNFNDVKITLNEVRIESGGEFDQAENDQFIVVNLTAENNSEEEVTMSSMVNTELYDDEGYSYSTTFLTEGIKGQFDGSVPSGKMLRGEIPFDVPESGKYELHFSDPFQSGKAIWVIDSEDLK